jgi:AmiR/NasT family two-component response regulator
VTLERLRAENHEIRRENEQLRGVVGARALVERAKGVLIERLDLSAEDVSELLGLTAQSSRRSVDELADEILTTRVTPACIEGEIGHLRHRGPWFLKSG